MILVDTSIWVDHLKNGNHVLFGLLDAGQVLMHPFVIGELALGGLYRYPEAMNDVEKLPSAVVADDREVLHLIATVDLANSGIGYADAHLLASTLLQPGTSLWTRDKKLHAIASRRGMAAIL